MSAEREQDFFASGGQTDHQEHSLIKLGVWEFRLGEPRAVSCEAVRAIESYLSAFNQASKKDSSLTAAETQFGIPTCLVRVDASPRVLNTESPEKAIYEIETRPAGLGLLPTVAVASHHLEILNSLRNVFAQFPSFSGFATLSSIGERATDTQVGAEILGFPFYNDSNVIKSNGLMWVRGASCDSPELLQVLEPRSLCPITAHGDKTYLLRLGLAQPIEQIDNLPWETGFVIKPLIGSKMEGVAIFLSSCAQREMFGRNPPRGLSTRSQVERELDHKFRPYLFQNFIAPGIEQEQRANGPEWKITIARLYFGWDLRENKWKFVAGLWNSRPNMRVHGASDSTFGLMLQQ